MKNDIEMIKEVVEEIGLRPRFDEDGDLVVRYQLKTIFFFAAEESSFVSMAMPRIYKVKEGEEALAFAVCNKLTRDIKLIKFYLEETLADVSASCEFYFSDRESLKNSSEQAFRVMGVANTTFFKTKEELEEDE